jgi:hypothetical protein
VAAMLLTAGPAASAGAEVAEVEPGDLLVANHSFESGTDEWTLGEAGGPVPRPSEACSRAVSISTEQHLTGTASLRLAPSRGCAVPGALSAPVPARAGESYRGYVSASTTQGGEVAFRLVFRDERQQVLAVANSTSGPAGAGRWSPLSVTGKAPARTAAVSLQVRLSRDGGPVYVDDVLLSAQETNLGAQISSASINAATFGVDAEGSPTGYAVLTGNAQHDARLIGVDALSGELTTNLALPGATGAWNATTASDGRIYVGSYNYDDPVKGGRLYQYTPGAGSVVDLGSPIAGDTFIWNVTAGPDGTVFGGGYPSGGAFRYTPDAGFTQVGGRPLAAPEQYARSVAYDPTLDMLYVGIGAHAHLMACPGGGPTCTDILPAEYAEEEFAYSVSAGDGHVFVNLSPSGDGHLAVLKVTRQADGSVSATTVRDIPTVKYPGASPVVDGSVYYVGNNRLSRYDIATDTVTSLGRGLPVGPRAWGVDSSAGRPVLTTMGNSPNGPTVVRYDIQSDALASVSAPEAPAIPTDLQSIQTGPDGRIYSSGFRSGTVGVYTPMRSDLSVRRTGISQAEGSTTIGDTLYWGTYPGAIVYAYKPSEPWRSGTNPKVVCALTEQDQDRPYGMVNADGKLYIGTMAGYGKLEGALSVYDPETGECTTWKNPVPRQSIVSLAHLDGKVYAGTSIWGGLGIEPTQTEAKLLIHDTATGSNQTVDLPSRGLRTALALTVGPDNRIWMVAEDHILVYDPIRQRFVVDEKVFGELDIPGDDLVDAHDAFLTVGADGMLYGTIHGSYLYRLDPSSLRVTILRRGNVHHVATDDHGNLYYVENGYELHRLLVDDK